jgi:dTMP kinase
MSRKHHATTSDAAMVARLRGKFLVFDGPDGCGKSTQRARFAERLRAAGGDVVETKDPGGTVYGDMIRRILLDHDLATMDVRCEAFLFMASRAQLVGEVVRPALAAGRTVLCDRFISATCAYQVAAGYDVERVLTLGRYAVEDTWPDFTVVIDVPPSVGFARTGRQASDAGRNRSRDAGQGLLIDGARTDAMEARPLEFHQRVRDAYLSLPQHYPKPLVIVDGAGDPASVHERVWKAVADASF